MWKHCEYNQGDEWCDLYDRPCGYDDWVDCQDGMPFQPEDYYDDSMDGDHESGLASAGWGTDEDYGYYGDDY